MADRNFLDACRSHDFGYDLIRNSENQTVVLSNDQVVLVDSWVRSSRAAVDREFNDMMGRVCGAASWFGLWTKTVCQAARAAYYVGVQHNSIEQQYLVP
jgi:hypothetical protein